MYWVVEEIKLSNHHQEAIAGILYANPGSHFMMDDFFHLALVTLISSITALNPKPC